MKALNEFLADNQKEILALSIEKTSNFAGDLRMSKLLKSGLSLFLDQLIEALEGTTEISSKKMLLTGAAHGKEHLRLGYSLSHVVHSYGAICQTITETASLKNFRIKSSEFNTLNGCLDVAIAVAVTEYQFRSTQLIEDREVKQLGFLVHELRNALSSASIAHEMIKAGLVGTRGSTSDVLEQNLVRMRNLIDRSLSEVRMRSDSDLFIERFRLFELLDQIVITARSDASKKEQSLLVEVDEEIELEGDRQILISAIANLIQNAIKYSKWKSEIWIRAKPSNNSKSKVCIEIEDSCGGLDPDKIKSLFNDYVQNDSDRSGLGLGLSIVQRATYLSQGKVLVKNNPPKGCKFILEIPIRVTPTPSNKKTVEGKNSAQPSFKKNT